MTFWYWSRCGSGTTCWALKGHGKEPDFPRFLRKSLWPRSLTSRSDFGLEFSEIFVFEKRLPDSTIRGVGDSPYQRYAELATLRINDMRSRRLSDSTIRGVDNSPHHWYAESMTPRFTDTENGLFNFLKENSLYQWCGESSTPRIVESESCRLRVSLIRRVADSLYHWIGESTTPRIGDKGSR